MSQKIGLIKVAKTYAEALFTVSEKSANEAKVLADLEELKNVFETSDELRLVLDHPSVKPEEKAKILETLFASKVQADVMSLLLILLEKRRMNVIPQLADIFKQSYYKKQNKDIARVSSAKELDQAQLAEIKEKLEAIFNKSLEIETHTDESLIAGIKVNVGDKVLDSSVRAKLKQMRQLLTA